jgi:hypothetical protein
MTPEEIELVRSIRAARHSVQHEQTGTPAWQAAIDASAENF